MSKLIMGLCVLLTSLNLAFAKTPSLDESEYIYLGSVSRTNCVKEAGVIEEKIKNAEIDILGHSDNNVKAKLGYDSGEYHTYCYSRIISYDDQLRLTAQNLKSNYSFKNKPSTMKCKSQLASLNDDPSVYYATIYYDLFSCYVRYYKVVLNN